MTSREFAHSAHESIDQRRKYSGDPYWVHTDEVSDMVFAATRSEICSMAGDLHDVIEDVYPLNKDYSLPRIEELFGEAVSLIVEDLTDVYTSEAFPHMNRDKRKGLEAERFFSLGRDEFGYETHSVKLCDLISNTQDIASADPGFARVYLKEKELLLHALYAGDAKLKWKAKQVLEAAKRVVELKFASKD